MLPIWKIVWKKQLLIHFILKQIQQKELYQTLIHPETPLAKNILLIKSKKNGGCL